MTAPVEMIGRYGLPLAAREMIDAVRAGDVSTVSDFLDAEASPSKVDRSGISMLHIAIDEGHRAMAELLIARGHVVNVIGRDDATPLHLAALRHDERICQLLIAAGAVVNCKADSGQTPLHLAASFRSGSLCQLLIEHSADPNALGTFGEGPLLSAVRNGYLAPAEVLLGSGARVEGVTSSTGATYLELAVERDDADMCSLLLKHGADVRQECAPIWGGAMLVDTPLHLACLKASVPVARVLVDAGLSPSYVPSASDNKHLVLGTYLTAFQLAINHDKLKHVAFFVNECGESLDQVTQGGLAMEELARSREMQQLLRSIRMTANIDSAVQPEEGGQRTKPSASGMSPL